MSMSPKHKKTFKKAGEQLQEIMRELGCSTCVLLLERGGACAVIIDGTTEAMDSRRLCSTIDMWRERLREIGEHADNGGFSLDKAYQCFTKNKSGVFEETSDFFRTWEEL